MLMRVPHVLRCVWRGLWQPTWPLPRERRWWHHIDYWPRRIRDIISAGLVFLMPPWFGFFMYEMCCARPKAMFAFGAIVGTVWLFAVVSAYYAGRDP